MVVLATAGLGLMDKARPRTVASLLGCWTWMMMVARPAFAILDATYRWIQSFEDDEMDHPQPLWKSVRDELRALSVLSIFFEVNLETEWHEQVYMTDASNEGFAAVVTTSSAKEIRQEIDMGAERTWRTQALSAIAVTST